MPTPLSLTPSFGFGDRLGLATPGHIAAVRETKFAPIFAQQSVRENARTGRTPQQVVDDAKRAVDSAHWEAPWGADADHLKPLTIFLHLLRLATLFLPLILASMSITRRMLIRLVCSRIRLRNLTGMSSQRCISISLWIRPGTV
jgi:hypothetical protein